MNLKCKCISLIIITLVIISSFSFGQIVKDNIIIGQTITLQSKVLNESREIFIRTPEGYEQENESYPVLYVLDGETHFFIATAAFFWFEQNHHSSVYRNKFHLTVLLC